MPLRDHFHPPISDFIPWESLHGTWPALMALALNEKLPSRYIASPRIHLGTAFEIDVATLMHDRNDLARAPDEEGGVATAVWAPPQPTLALKTEFPEQDAYEVLVHETSTRRLVAAVEIVSPSNKDRPENRHAFAAKCATLLRQGVAVSIVDAVTERGGNLYCELLDQIGERDLSIGPPSPALYAIACRWLHVGQEGKFESWFYQLYLGNPLPTLPLWLDIDIAAPLDLEASYERSCRGLRIS
ncbi:MAG TPA: DUF4058 family protein [Tepidisphaeraceae bacterium]|nr:DUF4058 family protein [Tepidisphaeraceae bacterium]